MDGNPEIHASAAPELCEGDSIVLSSQIDYLPDSTKFSWTGPAGFKSDLQNTLIKQAIPAMTGTYYVKYESRGYSGIDSVKVKVIAKPVISIGGNLKFCRGDSTRLSAKSVDKGLAYVWSTGDTTNSICVRDTGTYKLTANNSGGCISTSEVLVSFYDTPTVKITGDNQLCRDNPLILKAESDDAGIAYQWSTGEITKAISVSNPGFYSVTVTSTNGCKAIDTINVDPPFKASIEIDGMPCTGGDPVLKAVPDNKSYNYHWSTNETGNTIKVNKAGEYSLEITNQFGCKDTARVEIYPDPVVSISGDTTLCPGKSLVLSVPAAFKSYQWNSGDTINSINVEKPGKYLVTVTDDYGCTSVDSIVVNAPELELSGMSDIQFSNISPGMTELKTLRIKNISAGKIHVSSVMAKNSGDIFNIETIPVVPADLSAGDEITINCSFKPAGLVDYSDSLIVETDSPCADYKAVQLYGTTSALTTVYLPDATAYIGDMNYCIPLRAKKDSNSKLTGFYAYSAEIRFDASAFIPTNAEWKIESDERAVRITGDSVSFTSDDVLIGNICGQIFLADSNKTPLRITEFKWADQKLIDSTIDGSLSITGLCQKDISRIFIFHPTDISISSNPVSDNLTLTIMGEINTDYKFGIYSIEGVGIASYSGIMKEKQIILPIDLTSYASGVYFIIFSGKVCKFIKY